MLDTACKIFYLTLLRYYVRLPEEKKVAPDATKGLGAVPAQAPAHGVKRKAEGEEVVAKIVVKKLSAVRMGLFEDAIRTY